MSSMVRRLRMASRISDIQAHRPGFNDARNHVVDLIMAKLSSHPFQFLHETN